MVGERRRRVNESGEEREDRRRCGERRGEGRRGKEREGEGRRGETETQTARSVQLDITGPCCKDRPFWVNG